MRSCPATSLKVGDLVAVEAGEIIPSDGEVVEGVASVNEAAITGESAPVIRESGGDRSAVTGGTQVLSDWIRVRITAASGIDLPRPHDQPRRRRAAPEDAERDRAQHPARRHDADLRARGGDDPELRRLCRRLDPGRRARRAVRDADPDHHRRAAVGDRHRRHGPPGALQRACHVRPRGRGGGRRRHAASRQDRHHHARQSPGQRIPPGARRDRTGTGGCRPARLARRRNAGRPLDRRARQGEIPHPGARHARAACAFRAVHGADPHERRRRRRQLDPQGRGRCQSSPMSGRIRLQRWPAARQRSSRPTAPSESVREIRAIADEIAKRAARRSRWRATVACSASST